MKTEEVCIESDKVNLMGFIISIPIIIIFILTLIMRWERFYQHDLKEIKDTVLFFDSKLVNSFLMFLLPILILFIGIFIHELIHGIFMALFSKNSWTSVKFGFDKKHFMPYANCKEPIYSNQMLIVALAPFMILGLFPIIYGVFFNSLFWLFIGFSMSLGAIGDFFYAYLIITKGLNKVILDHESKVGFIIID